MHFPEGLMHFPKDSMHYPKGFCSKSMEGEDSKGFSQEEFSLQSLGSFESAIRVWQRQKEEKEKQRGNIC